MKTICINGNALVGKITGIERYAHEVLKRLDVLLDNVQVPIKVLFPDEEKGNLPKFRNIEIVLLGSKNHKVTIHAIKEYLRMEEGLYVSLCGNTCIQRGAIICTHDIRPWIYKEYDPFLFRFKCGINFISSKLLAGQIVTVTETSKREISKYLHIDDNRIMVISSGWEHMLKITEDTVIWDKYPKLIKGGYFYSVGSQAPHKNFKWIWENAKANPDLTFVVAGKVWNNKASAKKLPPNLIYLGFVTDEENKALMAHCKAFIFPSKYEGFGLPPLEALACGAQIMVSNYSCLPEVYSTCATLIDPDDYNYDFSKMETFDEFSKNAILKKYSWDRAAEMWLNLLIKCAV